MAILGWFSVQPCCVAPVFHTTNIGIGNSEKKTPMTTSEQAKCTSLNYILVCNCYEEFSIFAWKLPTITSMYISTLYIVHTVEQTHIHMENICRRAREERKWKENGNIARNHFHFPCSSISILSQSFVSVMPKRKMSKKCILRSFGLQPLVFL